MHRITSRARPLNSPLQVVQGVIIVSFYFTVVAPPRAQIQEPLPVQSLLDKAWLRKQLALRASCDRSCAQLSAQPASFFPTGPAPHPSRDHPSTWEAVVEPSRRPFAPVSTWSRVSSHAGPELVRSSRAALGEKMAVGLGFLTHFAPICSGASEDEYTFEPVLREAGSTTQVLSFSRASGKMSFNSARLRAPSLQQTDLLAPDAATRSAAPLKQVRCIMGIIQLNAGAASQTACAAPLC